MRFICSFCVFPICIYTLCTFVSAEYEKQDELKRSAMRALCALISIADADKNIVVNEFVAQIRANSEMAQVSSEKYLVLRLD